MIIKTTYKFPPVKTFCKVCKKKLKRVVSVEYELYNETKTRTDTLLEMMQRKMDLEKNGTFCRDCE